MVSQMTPSLPGVEPKVAFIHRLPLTCTLGISVNRTVPALMWRQASRVGIVISTWL